MSEWKEYKLGDIVTFTSGGTPSKLNEAFWGGNIPWISASSMEGYTYADSTLKITELGLKNGSKIAPKNSILLLVRGSILHQKLQVGIAERDVSFNQDVKCLQPNEDIIDPWFLLFWFKSEEKNLLNKVESTGIGAGKLDTPILKDLLIKVPPINERRKLNEFFKAIQGKIELNRKMNQTLEAMAQGLFKSWFVDFDPVIDNAIQAGNEIPEELQARAEKRKGLSNSKKLLSTNPSLAAKFPDSFVFNETLGKWIPEGWEVGKLGDRYFVKGGYAFKSKDFVEESGIPVVKIKSIKGDNTVDKSELSMVKSSVAKQRQDFWLNNGDILMAMTGATVGKFGVLVKEDNELIVLNQRVAKFYPVNQDFKTIWFVYCYFNDSKNTDFIVNTAQGSAQPNISANEIMSAPIVKSNISLLIEFEKTVSKSFQKILENQKQIQTLTQLRDRLLPELISGRVRVKEGVILNY